MTDAATPQPQPIRTPESTQVVPRVMIHVRNATVGGGYSPQLGEAICADIEARLRFGLAKYGHPLETHNGRDALMDAYQEALDCLNYLEQHRIEAVEAYDTTNQATRDATVAAQLNLHKVTALVFDIKEALINRATD